MRFFLMHGRASLPLPYTFGNLMFVHQRYLGVVGAGGIGQELKNSMDLLNFSRLLTILVIISIMVRPY